MYALPISDTEAIAVDDADPDTWVVHVADFTARTITSFSFEGVGHVQSAHYDAGRGLLWVIINGRVFAIKRSAEDLFEVEMPDEPFFVYTMIGEGSSVLVGGEYANLWRITLPSLEWQPLLRPTPKPPRSSDPDEQSRQTKAYARANPPFYGSFKVGDDHVFCGALGTLARVRGDAVETKRIDGDPRLVTGRAEGAKISLSADSPRATIYLGDFDHGFEAVFTDDLRALHRTALHAGRRYVGVAEVPPSDVHNLYTREDGKLVPVETKCAREPSPLISLTSTASALWAIDAAGVFRLADGTWTLVDLDDLRGGGWPSGAA